MANMITSLVLLLFTAFGGYMISYNNIPKYFYPIHYASPYHYAKRALMQNDFRGLTFACTPTVLPCPPGNYTIETQVYGNVTGPLAPESAICAYPCVPLTGAAILKSLGLDNSSIVEDCMILLGMIAILRILIFIILRWLRIGDSS